ncbi:hypothetical protein GCM10011369_23220 [Neiella marina]|uniref:Uncharacterized protein n=1 Tax=Neiella marina TaxID=508461 RepID=A0A8J2U5S8_9GAMM|nr:hypothetical protein [Neiella marina]GGA80641.1 hypothetical protein GCM10011369_23220 [Neiella marina]
MEQQKQIKTVLASLNGRVWAVNRGLVGEQLYVYQNNGAHCVIALVDQHSHEVKATFGMNALAYRDICLARAFLQLVATVRKPKRMLFAA